MKVVIKRDELTTFCDVCSREIKTVYYVEDDNGNTYKLGKECFRKVEEKQIILKGNEIIILKKGTKY